MFILKMFYNVFNIGIDYIWINNVKNDYKFLKKKKKNVKKLLTVHIKHVFGHRSNHRTMFSTALFARQPTQRIFVHTR